MYKVEKDEQQHVLRTELYSGLMDYLHKRKET